VRDVLKRLRRPKPQHISSHKIQNRTIKNPEEQNKKYINQKMMFKFSTLSFVLAIMATLGLLSSTADAHGYVTISRVAKCAFSKQNSGCGGNSLSTPQGVEGVQKYPSGGPQDGRLASGGNGGYTDLDAQTSSRWHKTNVSPGSYSFTWRHTANHASTTYEYYITKSNWNPNAPLTRAQFESTPFCSQNLNGAKPPIDLTHNCNLPSRSGYHVVLAVWNTHFTGGSNNAFYNAIDLQFSGTNTGTTTNSGGTCGGGNRGNGICADGTCCSQYGKCFY
jgi:chitin-binding protein